MDWINRRSFLCLFCRNHNRKPFKRSEIYDSIQFEKRKKEERVDCPMGCGWKGYDVGYHWKQECLERYIECKKCNEMCVMRHWKDHDDHCKKIACPIPNCSFQHVFSLTEEEIMSPHYYPIFFYFHFIHCHGIFNIRVHRCNYEENKETGLEYCTFENPDRILIQRFELDP